MDTIAQRRSRGSHGPQPEHRLLPALPPLLVGPAVLAVLTALLVLVPSPADAAALDTTITAGPSGPVSSRTAKFAFRSRTAGAAFQCRMDGSGWKKCTSPRKYTRLSQGRHVFRVRAVRHGRVDRTPARRSFTVDTVPPDTTITSGPEGPTDDRTPTFTFESADAAAFVCTLAGSTYDPCTSPFTSPTELGDDEYVFTVAAVDAAGNTDKTPAQQTFSLDTPLTMDPQTAAQAAEMYFPSGAITGDVPAVCSGDVTVDCPGGVPLSPADQVELTSSHVVQQVSPSEYLVVATLDARTLDPEPVLGFLGSSCSLGYDSAKGATPTLQATVPLDFVTDGTTGALRIQTGTVTLTGVEAADLTLTGDPICALSSTVVALATGQLTSDLVSLLEAWFAEVGDPLCAVPGPAYLGACPAP